MSGDAQRVALLCGTAHYDYQDEDLLVVPDELRTVEDLFTRLGYQVPKPLLDLTTEGFRRALTSWAENTDTDHAAVVYYTGHGEYDERKGRHYLLFKDSRLGQYTGTALATDDLIGIVTENKIRRLLLIIDTCFAGRGASDAVRAHARQVQFQLNTGRADLSEVTELSVVIASRAQEEAGEGAFAEAFAWAIDNSRDGGNRQRWLSLPSLIADINSRLGNSQHAAYNAYSEGFSFFPNPRYVPDLPDQDEAPMDLAEQGNWLSPEGQRRRAELIAHFGPRGRGADGIGGDRSYFTGRAAALAHLADWLNSSPTGPDRNLVVTGGPGVGKSSLLGRLVLLADSSRRATLHDVTTDIPLPRRAVDVAIHARHSQLEDIVSGIADAAGLATEDPTDLLEALHHRTEPLFILIDALDEAGPVGGTEPTRIAVALLVPMAELECVRLLIGTRPHVGEQLGSGFGRLDLDDLRWTSADDIETYARKLLLAPDGPGSQSPYTEAGSPLVPVAREIAHRAGGVYLIARLLARALAQQDQVVDVRSPRWLEQFPVLGDTDAVGEAFHWSLRTRLGAREPLGRALLAALAFAEGVGLAPGTAWLAIARTFTDEAVTEDDLRWILREAAPYLVEQTDPHGRSVYRLYHEAFAEDLRPAPASDAGRRVARALLAAVPMDVETGTRDWPKADRYLIDHLATHLTRHGLLPEVITDPLFLLTVDDASLHRALATALPDMRNDPHLRHAVAAADAWLRCAPHLRRESDLNARAAQLNLAATQTHAAQLAVVVKHRFPDLTFDVEWESLQDAAPYRAVGGFDSRIGAVAAFRLDGRPVIATTEAPHRVRLWDLDTGEELDELPVRRQESCPVVELAACDDGAGAWLLMRTSDSVTVWDVKGRCPAGPAYRKKSIWQSRLTVVNGSPVAILLDAKGIHVVETATGLRRLRLSDGLGGKIHSYALACGTHEGQLIVAAGGSCHVEDYNPDLSANSTHFILSITRHVIDPATWTKVESWRAGYGRETIDDLTVCGDKVYVATSGLMRTGPRPSSWLTEIDCGPSPQVRVAGVLPGESIPLVVGSVDGGIVATRGTPKDDQVVAFVATDDRAQPMITLPLEHGKVVVTTSTAAGGGTLKAWTIPIDGPKELTASLPDGSGKEKSALSFGRVGEKKMVLGRRGGDWIALDPESGRSITPWPFSKAVEGLVPARDPDLPAVTRLEIRKRSQKICFTTPQGRSAPPCRLRVRESAALAVAGTRTTDHLLVAHTGRRLLLWDLPSGKRQRARHLWAECFGFGGTTPTLDVARIGDRTYAALGRAPGRPVRVYELPSCTPVRVLHHESKVIKNRHTELVMAIGDWGGRPVVARAHRNGYVTVQDVRTDRQLMRWQVPDGNDAVRLRPLMSDGREGLLVLCSDDSLVLLELLDGTDAAPACRIRIGTRVDAWTLISSELVAVQTAAGPLCLRLPVLGGS
ncbi:caspase family protein [Streptomyces acidicola]|uniref:NACHT domain-containing protein n=1 Tax=Streptomyces acidicola TaxID=2596892 RepID=A0A5N8X1J0_9ACTN|nr:caspase family protein [Streptomyces acidicola]MPY52698.1 NACHT domain-containing protein [Streptomyces acidicola]